MGVNKIDFGNTTLIDLTDATATGSKILSGYTAYGKEGELMTGVAAGEVTNVSSLDELKGNWDNEDGFLFSYDPEVGERTYVTNTVITSKGVYEETTDVASASTWYFEQVSGYTDRFYVYTKISGENYYMYNDTGSGANFMGLSTTSKGIFVVSYAQDGKFYFKLSTGNKWLQHSKGGGGIRLYTDNLNDYNSRFVLTYKVNAIVPYGTLTITENGTYDVTTCKTIIVNIS